MRLGRKLSQFCLVVGLLSLMPVQVLHAAEAVVSQSYQADQKLEVGTLVSRDTMSASKVIKADSTNRSNVTGVVVAQDESFVSYNEAGSTVPVATSGVVVINLSTINGDIVAGDQLTVSPIAGFAMKASSTGKVIGRARSDFSKQTNGAQIRDVTDSKGKAVQVAIGQVQINVQLSDWALTGVPNNPLVDNLQTAASQLVGKEVSPSNAMVAALILGLAILVSGIVLFSSVSSSIHSLGRNPLSHTVIRRSLTQVILIVVALLIASVLAAYLIIGR